MTEVIPVAIAVQADRSRGPYRPLWNWFGYDEPNYTYTQNGKKLLGALAQLSPDPPRVRTHNLLTSGDGTPALKWGSTNAYTEDAAGRPVYDWTIMDRIFDAYVEAGVVPLVQIGFTPKALATDPEPYQHNWYLGINHREVLTTGWASPPKDLAKWSALVEAWANHLADRYGRERVTAWPWEVWNEPDGLYWKGTIPEFCALYDASAKAVKRALPGARVGGPHTCGPSESENAATFLRAFLQHVVDEKSPIDFIAFHAKGKPVINKDHVRMGVQKQLRDIQKGLDIIAEFPSLRHLPVVIGESDPEGCAACSQRYYPQNAYRNGPLYGVYIVESMMRTYEVSQRAGIEIEGAVTWAFLFEDQPYFEGFRDLATNGIDKAALNALRMLGMLGGEWLEAGSDHALPLDDILGRGIRDRPDINAVATRDAKGISILAWHYHDDDTAGETADVTISVNGLAGEVSAWRHYRMDESHSNAFAVWRSMGSPQEMTPDAYSQLEAASGLARCDELVTMTQGDGGVSAKLTLPRQGVSLLRLEI